MSKPLDKLKHHVTGAIERGEKQAIEAIVEPKHAPTPWAVDETFLGRAKIVDSVKLNICTMHNSVRSIKEDQANAAYIVKCVNMHDELIAAIEIELGETLICVENKEKITRLANLIERSRGMKNG